MSVIAPVDVHDDTALKAWYAVEAASMAFDRPYASHRTFEALANSVRMPHDHGRRVLLAAKEQGETIGIAELDLPEEERSHVVELGIHVLPVHRWRGVGTELWRAADDVRRTNGRTLTTAEVTIPPKSSLAFARALGFKSVRREDHLAADLPLPHKPFNVLGYEILMWEDRTPEDLLAQFVGLRNQMGKEMPGKSQEDMVAHTADRIRSAEKSTARSYDRITAAAREILTGELVGYSVIFLAHGSDEAIQDDTFVKAAHRGHKLGLALKVATLAAVQRDHPERTSIHTWTDPSNDVMQRINRQFGFRKIELMHEVQRTDRW
ncbi:GNAT family N-acetyltransferase [Nocardioides sp. NPDC057772]|uniref:GNAT family N-acetyltransferase n=1 Tax=Nocardioides sp. NPDC057772 TaxID=3346245 RepID=UPI00366E2730